MAWLAGWNRRKQLYINGTIAGAQSSYQMRITINYGSGTDSASNIYCGNNVNTDFSDIRFTDSSGNILLNYWIESYVVSSKAIVWVQIPSIPTGSNSTYIYIYYNNPSAISVSNGVNTFGFFDDFLGTSLDTTKWTYGGTGGSVSVSNSEITLTSNSMYVTTIVRSLQSYTPYTQNLAFRVMTKSTNINPSLNMKFGITTGIAPSSGVVFIMAHDAGNVTLERPSIDTGFSDITNYHIYEIRTTASSTAYLYIDDILRATKTDIGTGSDKLCVVGVDSYLYTTNITTKADWILIRKYTSPEPTWSSTISSEQSVTLNISSTPSGGEIWLATPAGSAWVDQLIQTNTTLYVTAGSYDIAIGKTGYQLWTLYNQTYTVGQIVNISATLVPSTGTLSISSTPSSRIFLNNVDQGLYTPQSLALSPGTYNLRLEASGYIDYTEIISITAGGTVTRSITMLSETSGLCPVTKSIGNTVGLQATPTGGTYPYTVTFYKKIDTNNPVQISSSTGVTGSQIVTSSYIINDTDVIGSTGDSFAGLAVGTIRFIVRIDDSCPTGSKSCAQYCDIPITCIAPVCNFTVM